MKMIEFLSNVLHGTTSRKLHNTRVVYEDGVHHVYLYGTEIFQRNAEAGWCRFTLTGWDTRTTRDRVAQCLRAATGEYLTVGYRTNRGHTLLGFLVSVPPDAWIRLEGRRENARFRCEDEAGAIEATKAFVSDRLWWSCSHLRSTAASLYKTVTSGEEPYLLPAMTLLRIYTEELDRRDKSRTA